MFYDEVNDLRQEMSKHNTLELEQRLAAPLSTIWEVESSMSQAESPTTPPLLQYSIAGESESNVMEEQCFMYSSLTSHVCNDQCTHSVTGDSLLLTQSLTSSVVSAVPTDPVTGYSTLLRDQNKMPQPPTSTSSADSYEYITVNDLNPPTHFSVKTVPTSVKLTPEEFEVFAVSSSAPVHGSGNDNALSPAFDVNRPQLALPTTSSLPLTPLKELISNSMSSVENPPENEYLTLLQPDTIPSYATIKTTRISESDSSSENEES